MPKSNEPKLEPLWENKPVILVAILIIGIIAIAALASIVLFVPGITSSSAPSGIAIIPLKGEISNESSGSFSTVLSANEIIALIDEAENDPEVGAIFIDIDSPGGEVVASKQIARKIWEVKKPTYSYINSVGASGGYYVASATDYIMADEDSITGSIGVVSIILNIEGLLEKIGVKATVLQKGELKTIGSPFDELSEKEKEILDEILEQAFNNFKNDILEFRSTKLTRSQLESIADGRILTGKQAYQKNLVDELLTREKAIDRAAELAGIEFAQKIEYGQKEFGLFDIFFTSGKAFGSGFISSVSVQSDIPTIK